ncbi:MAG: tRNA (guanosine(46)-N7)-methyltransferase TrmB [Coprobacillaceae bacterium]
MRLRNNPKAGEILEENSDFVITNPNSYKGKWDTVFLNSHPIHIEIGMGKGDFIYQLALQNPSINYIGIEKYPSVLAIAVKKVDSLGKLPNLKLLSFDAISLREIFETNEIAQIYLNFSDPWPKNRHAKRRLTSETFLPIYKDVLKDTGTIEFKTDNQGLFEYSLVSFNENKLSFQYVSLDLHKSDEMEHNIMTEYERKFCEKGPIYKVVVKY